MRGYFARIRIFFRHLAAYTTEQDSKAFTFSLLISLLHALCEVLVVTPLYFGSAMPGARRAPRNHRARFFYAHFPGIDFRTVL